MSENEFVTTDVPLGSTNTLEKVNAGSNSSTSPPSFVTTISPPEETNVGPTSSTPKDIFDRIFKFCMDLSPTAIINMINGLFDTHYPPDSKLTKNYTEFVDKGKLRRTLADTIITVNDTDVYHFEAQMKDENIVLRVFEYGIMHSLREMRDFENMLADHDHLRMHFPNQMIIYLDKADGIPDYYPIDIDFQGQGTFCYRIPVLHFQNVPPEDIRSKHLIILLPFKLLSMRDDIAKSQSEENKNRLLQLYRNDIIDTIYAAHQAGEITKDDLTYLLSVSGRLIEHLYQKYTDVWEDLHKMYEQSLTYDVDDILEMYHSMESALDESKRELADKNAQLAAQSNQLAAQDAKILALQEEIARLNRK